MRILLAEDEVDLARAVKTLIEHENYQVDCVYSGTEALSYLSCADYDGAVLDIMMPGMSGLEVLKELRAKGSKLPVLLLTAKSQVEDRVEGLDTGADDYLVKPFSAKELLARIRAMLRRKEGNPSPELSFADIKLDSLSSILKGPIAELVLGPKEAQLLALFMQDPKVRFSTERIYEKLWGYESQTDTQNVWVYISYLRKHLQSVGSKVHIGSKRGVGFALEFIDEN